MNNKSLNLSMAHAFVNLYYNISQLSLLQNEKLN